MAQTQTLSLRTEWLSQCHLSGGQDCVLEKRWRIAHYFSFLICIPLLAVLTMLSIGPHLAVCMCMCAYSVCVLRYFTLYPVYTFAGTDKDHFEVWKGKCKSFFSTVCSMRSSALRTAPTVRRFFPFSLQFFYLLLFQLLAFARCLMPLS